MVPSSSAARRRRHARRLAPPLPPNMDGAAHAQAAARPPHRASRAVVARAGRPLHEYARGARRELRPPLLLLVVVQRARRGTQRQFLENEARGEGIGMSLGSRRACILACLHCTFQ